MFLFLLRHQQSFADHCPYFSGKLTDLLFIFSLLHHGVINPEFVRKVIRSIVCTSPKAFSTSSIVVRHTYKEASLYFIHIHEFEQLLQFVMIFLWRCFCLIYNVSHTALAVGSLPAPLPCEHGISKNVRAQILH